MGIHTCIFTLWSVVIAIGIPIGKDPLVPIFYMGTHTYVFTLWSVVIVVGIPIGTMGTSKHEGDL